MTLYKHEGFTDDSYHIYLEHHLTKCRRAGLVNGILDIKAGVGSTTNVLLEKSGSSRVTALDDSKLTSKKTLQENTAAYKDSLTIKEGDPHLTLPKIMNRKDAPTFVNLNPRGSEAETLALLMEMARAKYPPKRIFVSKASQVRTAKALTRFLRLVGPQWRLEPGVKVTDGAAQLINRGDKYLDIRIPAGIGDCAWVFQKLQSEVTDLTIRLAASDPPRALGFCRSLSCVRVAEMCDVPTGEIIRTSIPHTTNPFNMQGAVFSLQANTPLENGVPIKDIFPDLKTDYSLKFDPDPELEQQVRQAFTNIEQPIGFYSSSATNIPWSGYSKEVWGQLLLEIHRAYPKATMVIIGAPYDKEYTDLQLHLCQQYKIPFFDMTTKTMPYVIESMKYMDSLLGFPSGIPIMSSLSYCPTLMLMPAHLHKMHNTWVDPELIANKKFINLDLADRKDIIPKFTKELQHGRS